MNENTASAFVRVYHHSGLQVSVPLTIGTLLSVEEAALLSASVDNLLAAGWLVDAPGLEEGETKELIGWVCRRAKVNDDGSETPMVDLYVDNEKMTFKILTVYLNNDDDVKSFESVSGLTLDKLPLFEGDNAPERGTPKAQKYVIRAARPFGVIHEPNPAYDPEKKKPKRRFVRWADAPASGANVVAMPQITTVGAKTERKPLTADEWKSIVAKAREYGVPDNEVIPALANVVPYPVKAGSQWLEGDVNALAALLAYKAGYNSELLKDVHPSVKPGMLLYAAAMSYVKLYQQKATA